MNGRGTTNVLLAIIAGALLFGQAAMVGALKWAALAAAAIIAIYVAVRFIAWAISGGVSALSEVVDLWGKDVPFLEKTAPAAGLIMIPFGIWFGLTWFWLWFSGVSDTKHAVLDTLAGRAWILILIAVLGGALTVGAAKAGLWLLKNRTSLPGRLLSACLYWAIGLFAVVAFPVNEVRRRRREGSGALGLVLAPAGMMLIGFAVSSVTASVSTLAVVAFLAGVGVID